MKNVTFAIVIVSTLTGVTTAHKNTSKAAFLYVQKPPNSYAKTTAYNSVNCIIPSSLPCIYTLSTDLGASTTKATLTAAGEMPHDFNRLYTDI